jgi:Ca2+-binding EF-hand superfamily protein
MAKKEPDEIFKLLDYFERPVEKVMSPVPAKSTDN